jgi:CheY-like chemotaxis protein
MQSTLQTPDLAHHARQLPPRPRAPIIMLSASDAEQGALRVGVNAFLRKPQDIGRLSATVTRLLTKKHYR